MKSLIGSLNTHCAGDGFVLGSGVFQYWSMVRCGESVSRVPWASVLSVISHFTFFTPTSAQRLKCGVKGA